MREIDFWCPMCKAEPGQECRTSSGNTYRYGYFHADRLGAFRPGDLTPPPPRARTAAVEEDDDDREYNRADDLPLVVSDAFLEPVVTVLRKLDKNDRKVIYDWLRGMAHTAVAVGGDLATAANVMMHGWPEVDDDE